MLFALIGSCAWGRNPRFWAGGGKTEAPFLNIGSSSTDVLLSSDLPTICLDHPLHLITGNLRVTVSSVTERPCLDSHLTARPPHP
jgi:hypothetical protein